MGRFIFEDLVRKLATYFEIKRGKIRDEGESTSFENAILKQDIGPFPQGVEVENVSISLNGEMRYASDVNVDISFMNPRLEGEIFIPEEIDEYSGDPDDLKNDPILIDVTNFFEIRVSVKPIASKIRLS